MANPSYGRRNQQTSDIACSYAQNLSVATLKKMQSNGVKTCPFETLESRWHLYGGKKILAFLKCFPVIFTSGVVGKSRL